MNTTVPQVFPSVPSSQGPINGLRTGRPKILMAVGAIALAISLPSGPVAAGQGAAAQGAVPQGAVPQGAAGFCGRPTGEPAALQEAIAKSEAVKQIYDGPEYIAFQDAKTEAVFTFTRAAAAQAHPAAVCRIPVRDGDLIRLEMAIVCRGTSDGCSRLESEFKKLNAQMEAHIRGQSGVPATQPR